MPKKGKKGKESTKFGKIYGGAVGAGYSNDEAAAMAYKATHGMEGRQRMSEAISRLRESMFPHLRRGR